MRPERKSHAVTRWRCGLRVGSVTAIRRADVDMRPGRRSSRATANVALSRVGSLVAASAGQRDVRLPFGGRRIVTVAPFASASHPAALAWAMT